MYSKSYIPHDCEELVKTTFSFEGPDSEGGCRVYRLTKAVIQVPVSVQITHEIIIKIYPQTVHRIITILFIKPVQMYRFIKTSLEIITSSSVVK